MKITKIPKKKTWGSKIYVEWIDSFTQDGWLNFDDMRTVPDETLCRTSGFYVGQNKNWLVICHTIGKTINNQCMGKVCVPLRAILKVR